MQLKTLNCLYGSVEANVTEDGVVVISMSIADAQKFQQTLYESEFGKRYADTYESIEAEEDHDLTEIVWAIPLDVLEEI